MHVRNDVSERQITDISVVPIFETVSNKRYVESLHDSSLCFTYAKKETDEYL